MDARGSSLFVSRSLGFLSGVRSRQQARQRKPSSLVLLLTLLVASRISGLLQVSMQVFFANKVSRPLGASEVLLTNRERKSPLV